LANALYVGKSLLESGAAGCVLVVTADVHSRILTPQRVRGQFGGLFGDGASAFVLRRVGGAESESCYVLGDFLFGCQGTYASALRIGLDGHHALKLHFEGEALARAAVEQLETLIEDLELRSGQKRSEAAAFATHQPNPRLVDLLARRLGVSRERFPEVARTCGNLGSSTCAVALSHALSQLTALPADERGPIFLASLGPGLLWGGCVMERRTETGR
jgi:3-oxoacyl-[acyl-carrier-protein] synthase-3